MPHRHEVTGEWAQWPDAAEVTLGWPDMFDTPTRISPGARRLPPKRRVARGRATWRVGDTVADTYEVLGVHGEGGMGLVYRVRHLDWGVDLAVKSPRPELFRDDADRARFTAEAETWVSLGLHPHVCSCHYVRTVDDVPRVFAEYVEGGSLRDRIDDASLYEGDALERILDLAVQTAWGLAHAHDHGVVHQDVKPANVLVDGDGVAKVTDFGIARAGKTVDAGRHAENGGTVLATVGGMTVAYASPEQAAGRAVGRRSDIWSLAVSVLEMFTGAVTWVSGTVAGAALAEYRRSGEGLRLPLPDDVARLLARCLRDNPEERPATMAAVAEALVRVYERLLGRPYQRAAPRPAELRADELNNRALSLLDLGRDDDAEEAFTQALTADPRHAPATYNRGLLRWRRGEIRDDELVDLLEELGARAAHPKEVQRLVAGVHQERGAVGADRSLADMDVRGGQLDFRISDGGGLMLVYDTMRGSVHVWHVATGKVLRTLGDPLVPHQRLVSEAERIDRSAAVSGGGTTAVLCGPHADDVLVYEVLSGKLKRRLHTPHGKVRSLAVDTSGRVVIVGHADGVASVWDTRTGDRLGVFEHRHVKYTDQLVRHVAISADGRVAASATSTGDIFVRDVRTGAVRCELTMTRLQHYDHGLPLRLSADGGRLVVGDTEGMVKVVDTVTGGVLRTLRAHQRNPDSRGFHLGVASVHIDPAGRLAITAGNTYDTTVRLWDLTTGRCLRTLDAGEPQTVWLSGDAGRAMCVSPTGVKRWEVVDPQPAGFELARPRGATDLAGLASNVDRLRQDAEVARDEGRHADARALLAEARATPGHERSPDLVEAWHEVGAEARHVGVRDVWTGPALEDAATNGKLDMLHLTVSGGAGTVLSSGHAMEIDGGRSGGAWEIATGRYVSPMSIRKAYTEGGYKSVQYVDAVSVSADGKVAIGSAGRHGFVLWDVPSDVPCETQLPELPDSSFPSTTYARFAVLNADGRHALTAAGETTTVWDTATAAELLTITDYVEAGALSADGRLALTVDRSGRVKLWDVRSGTCLHDLADRDSRARRGEAEAVALSGDHRFAVSAHGDALRVWDLEAGRLRHVLHGHDGAATRVTISSDNGFVLSGGADGTVRVWSTDTGECLHTIAAHSTAVHTLGIVTDGRFAVSAAGRVSDLSVRVWEIDWELG